jgi:hypothetical protein
MKKIDKQKKALYLCMATDRVVKVIESNYRKDLKRMTNIQLDKLINRISHEYDKE